MQNFCAPSKRTCWVCCITFGEANVLLVSYVLCVTYFWLQSNSSKVKSDSPILLLPKGTAEKLVLHLIPLSNQHGTTTTCQTTKLNNCSSKAEHFRMMSN